jgi:hypothetical protein
VHQQLPAHHAIPVPPDMPETRSATSLPARPAPRPAGTTPGVPGRSGSFLRAAPPAERIHRDPHGTAGAAIKHGSRSVQAPALGSALEAWSGVLAVIVPGWPVNEIVRHDPAAHASRAERYPVPAKAVQPGRPG